MTDVIKERKEKISDAEENRRLTDNSDVLFFQPRDESFAR
jgi:hypothetical protein